MSTTILWPTAVDFVDAVQNNRLSFTDPDLKSGKPLLDSRTRQPQYVSGGFATVCYIEHRRHKYAVKFFVKPDSDRHDRYLAVSRELSRLNLPYATHFLFREKEVEINGSRYPVLKMDYVTGLLLHK